MMPFKIKFSLETMHNNDKLLQTTPASIFRLCRGASNEGNRTYRVYLNSKDVTNSNNILMNLIDDSNQGLDTLDIVDTTGLNQPFNLCIRNILTPFDHRSLCQVQVSWSNSVYDIKTRISSCLSIPVDYICLYRPQGLELSNTEIISDVIASTSEHLGFSTRFCRQIQVSYQTPGAPEVYHIDATTRMPVKKLLESIAHTLKWQACETALFFDYRRLEPNDPLDFFGIDNGSRIEARLLLGAEHKLHKFFGPNWPEVAEVNGCLVQLKPTLTKEAEQERTPKPGSTPATGNHGIENTNPISPPLSAPRPGQEEVRRILLQQYKQRQGIK